MKNFKKGLIYTIVSLISLGTSGAAVYLSFGANDNSKGQDNANGNNGDDGDTVYPDMDGDDTEENGFSKMVNSLLASKELKFDNLSVSLDTDTTNPINLSLNNLKIDLTNSSSLDLNFSTDLTLSYDGINNSQINETINLNFTSAGFAYLSYGDNNYCFSAPKTIPSFMNMIEVITGSSLPDLSSSLGNLDMSSIKDVALKIIDTVADSETSNNLGGYDYTLTLEDINIKGTTISNIGIKMSTDSNNALRAIKTIDKNGADSSLSISGGVTLGLNGNCNFLAESDYVNVNPDDYQDLTNATNSILSTVTKIVGEKKTDVGINIALDTNGKKSTVSGLMQADVSSVDKDLTKGQYALSLTRKNSDNTYSDNLNINYEGSASTTYIKLNDDQFKGKITNSDISSIFTSVSSLTGKQGYEEISSSLTSVLGKCAFSELLEGDYTNYKTFIDSFSYTENVGFSMVINAKAFGLSDYKITVRLNLNESDKKIESIFVGGLQYQTLKADITLTPSDFTSISSINSVEYKSYSAIVPIFNTLTDIVKNKKAGASYSLLYADSSSQDQNYSASGRIDADLSSVSGFDDMTAAISKGNYHLSFNTAVKNCTHNVNVNYQDETMYFGYGTSYTKDNITTDNTIFKNSITKTNISSMVDVINKNSAADSSEALSGMDKIISEVENSANLKADLAALKEGYVSSLKSFVSIDKDNTDPKKIVVVLDVPYVLEGTSIANKVGAITLSLNTSDMSLDSITCKGAILAISNTNTLTFTMNFDSYNSNVNDPAILSDTKGYTEINKASELMESFYNLKTDLQKVGIGVNASLTQGDKKILGLEGEAKANITDINSPLASGIVNLTHSSLSGEGDATQKVEFNYQNDSTLGGQFVGEYNDNMHIMMHTSTVSDIYSEVKTSYNSETNVLFAYLNGLNKATNSLPIADVIETKDISSLFAYPYINKVEITDSTLSLKVDGRLLNYEDEGKTDTIEIGYDADDKHLTYAKLEAEYQGLKINCKIDLKSYDSVSYDHSASMLSYSDTTKGQFVDLDCLSTLTSCLIDTTENNYYGIEGDIKINAKPLNYLTIDLISTHVSLDVYIGDEQVYTYVAFNNGNKTIADKGFLATEFFLSQDNTYVMQTKNTTGTTAGISSEYFKTTKEDIVKNIAYYLTDYVLDIDNFFGGKVALAYIFKGMSDSSSSSDTSGIKISDDFSGLIKNLTLNTASQTVNLGLNLNSLLPIDNVDFEKTSLTLGYTTNTLDTDENFANNYTPFYAMTLAVDVNAYDAVKAHCFCSFTLKNSGNYKKTAIESADSPMYRYFQVSDTLDKENLTSYAISSIGDFKTTWYGVYNNYTVYDNAALAKKYQTSYTAESLYFYKN